MKEYEVSWREIKRNGEIVIKRAAFESADKRFKFCLRLEKREGYLGLIGFRNPAEAPLVVFG